VASKQTLTRIQLCTGLLCRGDAVLLVRSTYDGEPSPLWALPGGRQEHGETIADAVVREFREETSLDVRPETLAYVSESIDKRRGFHVVNCTFYVREADPHAAPRSTDPKVTDVRFVPGLKALELLSADVLRIPVEIALSMALCDEPRQQYFAFDEDDVAVPFFGRPAGAVEA
jgi:ADP-ribose pyrophosphatase YjhB (NUDIX family)